MKLEQLAKYFDHTILKQDASDLEVEQICKEALEYGFFSVCVNPCHVKAVKKHLAGSAIKVCSVIGFPLGANTSETKAFETKKAVSDGANEIDMVINVGALKDNNIEKAEADIKAVVQAAQGNTVKVIIETCLLTRKEKIDACMAAQKAGAHFVKTSTGFAGGGATFEDVELMKKTVQGKMQVKASGGIKTLEDTLKMIEAGADRIGASAGAAILKAF
ncbi:MAG: deoxyribose-phosphate aldolase [Desulfobacula sp.]|nr:deoxyribose-phosphate aldolase [Desulfobacula sp.]